MGWMGGRGLMLQNCDTSTALDALMFIAFLFYDKLSSVSSEHKYSCAFQQLVT